MRKIETLALCVVFLLFFSATFSHSASYLALTIFKSFGNSYLYISLWLFGVFISSLLLFIAKSLIELERINIERSYFLKNFLFMFFILLLFSFLMYRVLLKASIAQFAKESMEKLLYASPDLPSMNIYSYAIALFNVALDTLILGYLLGYSKKFVMIAYFILAPFLYFLLMMVLPDNLGVIVKGISLSIALVVYHLLNKEKVFAGE